MTEDAYRWFQIAAAAIAGLFVGAGAIVALIWRLRDRLEATDREITTLNIKLAEMSATIDSKDNESRHAVYNRIQSDIIAPLDRLEATVHTVATQVAVLMDRDARTEKTT